MKHNRERKPDKEKKSFKVGSVNKHKKKKFRWNGTWKGVMNGNCSDAGISSKKNKSSVNGSISSPVNHNGIACNGIQKKKKEDRLHVIPSRKKYANSKTQTESSKGMASDQIQPPSISAVGNGSVRNDELDSRRGLENSKDEILENNTPAACRESLPVMKCKEKLVTEFGKHSTFVIIGETGSGKTTQIPQFIFEENLHKNRCIAITQPRRIAAITMAKRVAEERKEQVGTTVGYSVRFEDMTSESTQIKYMTDGMLLREAMLDNCLRKYSWIILDEAHERTIHTDVLFGVVKAAQQTRAGMKTKKRLKMIIMSATMDVDNIKNYFENCAVLYIQGREHPVTINYLKSPVEDGDYTNAVVKTVFQLHESLPLREHVLVFLTGQEEIESVAHFIRKVMHSNKFAALEVRTLYASLSYEAQLQALAPPENGVRRCILSTNVAETSLTIPGIRVVIDAGKVKTRFQVRGTSSVERLQVVPISQAQAWQRSGRAGRLAPGKCYRLYTVDEFEKMPLFPVPEIQRSNMAGVVLNLVKIGVRHPLSFDWIDGPSIETLQSAIDELLQLGALVSNKEPLELTDVGHTMAKIPLDPPLAKVLVNARCYGVLEPVMTILSILSSESLLSSSQGKRQGLKKRFRTPEGDLISYLKIYREFKKTATKSSWCKINGFNLRALQYAAKVRSHLRQLCEKDNMKLDCTVSGPTMYENVRKCFYESLPLNCAVLQQGNRYLVKHSGQMGFTTKIHPSSALFNSKAPIVMFTEILQVAKDSHLMCHVSLVDPDWMRAINKKQKT